MSEPVTREDLERWRPTGSKARRPDYVGMMTNEDMSRLLDLVQELAETIVHKTVCAAETKKQARALLPESE